MLHIKIAIFMLPDMRGNQVGAYILYASAFLTDYLNLIGRSGNQFVLCGQLSLLAFVGVQHMGVQKQVQRVIDRPDRYMLRLAGLYQLLRRERLRQLAECRQNHIPHLRRTHLMLTQIAKEDGLRILI